MRVSADVCVLFEESALHQRYVFILQESDLKVRNRNYDLCKMRKANNVVN